MSAPPTNLLCVFAKMPQPGAVKTRLAASVGAAAAARLYEGMLRHTLRATVGSDLGWETAIHYSPDSREAADYFATLAGQASAAGGALPQAEGDLGARMRACIRAGIAAGAERVAIVGSDCPSVDASLIREAFERLGDADVVLGPSLDGGYYLIAARADHPELFEDVAWSGPDVLEATLARAAASGLRAAQLTPLRDIDEESDLDVLPPELIRLLDA